MYKRCVCNVGCLCLLLLTADIVRKGLTAASSLASFPVAGIFLCFLVFRFRVRRVLSCLIALVVLWLPLYEGASAPRASEAELIALIETLAEKAAECENALALTARDIPAFCGEKGCVKLSRFPEWMAQANTAGIYIPLTGEAIISPLEPDFSLPFVAMHEIAHQKGIMDEGSANLYAYEKCLASENASARYSAYVFALKYAFLRLRGIAEETAFTLRKTLSARVENDLHILGVWNGDPSTRAFPPFAGDYGDLADYLAVGNAAISASPS